MKRLAGMAGLAAIAAFVAFGAVVEDKVTKSVGASPGGKLVVDIEYGSIEVKPADIQRVDVEVQRKIDAPSRAETDRIINDFQLQVSMSGGDVVVKGVFRDGWKPRSEMRGRRRQICHDNRCLEYAEYLKMHHYMVMVPRQFSADLTTSGGSIDVGDISGTARAKTSGGSLKFGRIGGQIWGRTSGGSITLAGSKGPADVGTSGGSVTIGDVAGDVNAHTSGGSVNIERAAGRVKASTSGGSVHVREAIGEIDASTSGGSVSAYFAAQPKAPCRLSTSGGNIVVELAGTVGVDVDASTSGGRVVTDFPVTVSGPLRERELRSPINGGGPSLYLRTSGGSIHIRKAGPKKI